MKGNRNSDTFSTPVKHDAVDDRRSEAAVVGGPSGMNLAGGASSRSRSGGASMVSRGGGGSRRGADVPRRSCDVCVPTVKRR